MIPSQAISIASFMGIIVHEWAHKLFCRIFGVKVLEVKYWSLQGGYVKHEKIKSIKASIFISFAPLIVNSLIAIFLGVIFTTLKYFDINFTLLYMFVGYLGITIGMQAFPSKVDTEAITILSLELKKKKLAFLSKVITFIFDSLRVLSILWLDVFFGVLLLVLPMFLLRNCDSDFNTRVKNQKNMSVIINEFDDNLYTIKKIDVSETKFPVSIYTQDKNTGEESLKKNPYGGVYYIFRYYEDTDRNYSDFLMCVDKIEKKDCEYILSSNFFKNKELFSLTSCQDDENNMICKKYITK